MPTGRGDFGVAVVSGKIYVIGGTNGTDKPLSIVEEYNPATNEWTTKRSMPTPRSNLATAVYNGKIYAIGGIDEYGCLGINEMYDPVTDRWETKRAMPTPRSDLCANTVNQSIYLIGGETLYSNITNLNEVYNPVDDSWTTKAPLPNAVKGYSSTVVNNKIYIIGGAKQTYSSSSLVRISENQVYNTQTDRWSSEKAFPFAVSWGVAIATIGFMAPQRIYHFGGSSAENHNRTEMFDPTTNSWSNLDSMPILRDHLGVASINDMLYVIGGFNGTNWVNTMEQFKPLRYGLVPPMVQITAPENKTYRDVPLAFTVNRNTHWAGYSIDGETNITIGSQKTLYGLSQGVHRIVIYANDSSGNMGSSNTVYFSVDTEGPIIDIIAPINQAAYSSADIELIFTLNEPVSDLSYSLNGEEKITLAGNVTLPSLPSGGHRLTIYATDEVGNSSEETVYFNIEQFPFVYVIAVIVIIIIVAATLYLLYKHKSTKAKTASNIKEEPM